MKASAAMKKLCLNSCMKFSFHARVGGSMTRLDFNNPCLKGGAFRSVSQPETLVSTASFPIQQRAVFEQGSEDQGFAQRRTVVRRTRKPAD